MTRVVAVDVDLVCVRIEVHARHVAVGIPFFAWLHLNHRESLTKFSALTDSKIGIIYEPHLTKTRQAVSLTWQTDIRPFLPDQLY